MEHIQFGLCRVPCYLLGYSLAHLIMEEKKVKVTPILAMTIGLYALAQVLGIVFGIPVSVFWLEGVILLVLFAYVIEWLKSESIVLKCLNFMGTISLESYCTNVFLLPFFMYLPWQMGGMNLNPGNWSYYIIGTSYCILIFALVNKISGQIIKGLS